MFELTILVFNTKFIPINTIFEESSERNFKCKKLIGNDPLKNGEQTRPTKSGREFENSFFVGYYTGELLINSENLLTYKITALSSLH